MRQASNYIYFSYEYPCNSALFIENIILISFECRDNFALNQITTDMWVYLWTVCSISLADLSVLLPTYLRDTRTRNTMQWTLTNSTFTGYNKQHIFTITIIIILPHAKAILCINIYIVCFLRKAILLPAL